MSEFKVAGTYICTTAHYTHYKIFYNNIIFYRLIWGYNAANKKQQNKSKQKKSHNLKITIELRHANNRRPASRFTSIYL